MSKKSSLGRKLFNLGPSTTLKKTWNPVLPDPRRREVDKAGPLSILYGSLFNHPHEWNNYVPKTHVWAFPRKESRGLIFRQFHRSPKGQIIELDV
ncbi:unnamed protein product [Dovyalis caffra]|uniref:Uncharacterized protein n=1 Tax=Dovyalis caffra TaxID=77055 RepID=A0AAV1RTH8_9ROSI|nr:unnamed protein product [Dovyalis caffra]